ncbi:hypothetical protein CBR_g51796 [Chara braunii]|uniref:Retrotransposon gag domain-containing protein n=1 Tax=Chara braunii TaxID=69332 RepID=A0A388M9C3_CHABU|nr:hypothetical protein CBR_g51796 [Chara braunii]|eukprot:GBG91062.1 hypothetical protein CBR_g51796 [Chara braunii]
MGSINHTDLKLDKDVRAAIPEDWKWATFRERLSRAFACDDIFYSVEDLKEIKKEEGETLVAFARRFETTSELLIENGFLGEIERCGIFIGILPIERREFVMENTPTKRVSFAQTKALALQIGGPDAKTHLRGVLEKLGKGVPGSHLEKQFGDEDGRQFMPPDKTKVSRDSGEWKGGNRGDWKNDDDKGFQDRGWRSKEEEEKRRRSYSEGWETVEEIETLRDERERMKRMKDVLPRRSAESLENPLQQEPQDRRRKDPEKTVERNERRKIKCANDEKNISCGPSTKMNTDVKTGTTQEVIQEIQGEIWVSSIRFEENRYTEENEKEDTLCRTSTEMNIGIKARTAEELEQRKLWVSSFRSEEDLDPNDSLTVGVSSIQFESCKEDSDAALMCAKKAYKVARQYQRMCSRFSVAPSSSRPAATSQSQSTTRGRSSFAGHFRTPARPEAPFSRHWSSLEYEEDASAELDPTIGDASEDIELRDIIQYHLDDDTVPMVERLLMAMSSMG